MGSKKDKKKLEKKIAAAVAAALAEAKDADAVEIQETTSESLAKSGKSGL